MGRPSVIPGIRMRLEAWLDAREAEYLAQREGARQATLPLCGDGKVNVRAVAEAIQLSRTQEKYLYERKELAELINCIAEGQGVLTIGSRVNQSEADAQVRRRMAMQTRQADQAEQAATEAIASQKELISRIQELSAALEAAKAENGRMRAQLEAVREGIWLDTP
jgi:paraquat-inducible protein B